MPVELEQYRRHYPPRVRPPPPRQTLPCAPIPVPSLRAGPWRRQRRTFNGADALSGSCIGASLPSTAAAGLLQQSGTAGDNLWGGARVATRAARLSGPGLVTCRSGATCLPRDTTPSDAMASDATPRPPPRALRRAKPGGLSEPQPAPGPRPQHASRGTYSGKACQGCREAAKGLGACTDTYPHTHWSC